MAQSIIPVTFSEAVNLPSLGISADAIKFGSCTMESERFITVCETVNGQSNVVMVDLINGNQVTRRPISAEAAIMNPTSKIIALRAGPQVQMFNLDQRAKIKSHQMTETVVFWRWVNPNTIAMVTPTAVYHWGLEGDGAPSKMFDRHASLAAGSQIINYKVSFDGKWCLLIGISQGEGGSIQGTMQLYSVEKRVSQVLSGHTGTFAQIKVPGREDNDLAQVLCFTEKKADSPQFKLFVMEVGRDKNAPGGVFRLQPQDIPMPREAPNDFPVAMQLGTKHDVLYMITKMGYLFMFDVHSGKALYRAKISNETIFVTCPHVFTGGILGVTARSGQVLMIGMNEATLVPYVAQTLRDNNLAIALASRLNLPGADDLYLAEFNRLLGANDVPGAARLAATSPQGLLRTPETIQRFQSLPTAAGQPAPVFQYFSILLETQKLSATESIALAKPVVQQGRAQLLEKWLKEDKLECSEELGDAIAAADVNMALSVYLRANVPEKAINCFVQRGEYDKVVAYAQKVGYRADYTFMLQNLMRSNPQGAMEFAKRLATNEGGSLIDLNQTVETFMSMNRIQETTALLLEALKGNKKEEGYLQTKLLEINLMGGSPQVADAILQNEMFTHYDRPFVAKLCEQAGLFQRALEHYTDLNDVKRVMQNTHVLNPEFLINYFGTLSREASLEVLKDLLARNMRQNLNIVVQIAAKYCDQIGPDLLIQMFEQFKSAEGLFFFLGQCVNFSQEPDVHFKYIEAAAKMGNMKEVERVCRDSTVYDPEPVKKLLMDMKLPDPRPLIHVCDRHDFIDEMTGYLYSNNLLKYIEVYVTKVSPQKTPKVVGKLLDLDCNEDFVRGLLNATGLACPVEELVEEVERRNRLRLLQPWLEARLATGNTETATHNAIGKIYITLNRDPQQFLTNNQFYDPAVLGKYCEKLDPSLAFIAYKRAGGACDDELLRVTSDNGLFKDQARYLVEKQDMDLWGKVLNKEEGEAETPQRRALIDQVVQTALPETKNPDEVSTTVKAFMQADLPQELIELLERIVLQGSEFSNNSNLQNLLILTAMRADKDRVNDYINRLDNFDGPEIASIAITDQYELYEEAFVIYTKFGKKAETDEERKNMHVSAVEILVEHLKNLDRAQEFAERVSLREVWSKLAKAQLDEDMVNEAIGSYIKANDPSHYTDVIDRAKSTNLYENLVPYLKMARVEIKEAMLDTELIYAYAKSNMLSDLEEFIAAPNVANIQDCGERCYDEGIYEAAKILFKNINNNAKLALCFVNLMQFREAVDAAQKANSVSTWKEVNIACVKAKEFRLAAMCGLHIIVHPDHLEEIILHYERSGFPEELINLMESGLGAEGAHAGVYTELGILYSKYKPDKLMEHIKIFHNRMNLPKLLRACEKAMLWAEAVYLYKEDRQHDNAVKTMVEHSICFQHDLFLDCIQKARNQEIFYKGIQFYLEQQPLLLERLLQVLTPSLDHARVVHQLRKAEQLPLVQEYLKSVQKENLSAVNEALNELYIEDEDYESLRQSIDDYDNYDQIALAQKVEKHELLEFRRIAAYIYKKNKRWQQSVHISKQDKMYKDAIDTAAQSNDADLAEELLRFFVSVQDKESFCACLYTCYSLIRPDIAMELAWRNGYVDFAMPFMIQYMRNLHDKVEQIEERTKPKKEEEEEAVAAAASAMIYGETPMLMNGVQMIANQAYDPSMGMGMPQQGMNPGMMPQPGMGGMPGHQQQFGGNMGGGGFPGQQY
mmetsp:Transcript_15803/g.20869  ORF Transcript_15803/g.20869 Transcript_15803/m.20869 type:complete len:1733 (+) Transcript_15803:212-5410(+)